MNYKKSQSKLAEKNPQWKGELVGRNALHGWVNRRLKKPELCDKCRQRKAIDLANISNSYNPQTYNRDFKNWRWLCRHCHMKEDGRLKQFKSHRKSLKMGNQMYKLANPLKGENAPWSKLNNNSVLAIRKEYSIGKTTLIELANKYNVCFQSISLIVNRKSWKHLP